MRPRALSIAAAALLLAAAVPAAGRAAEPSPRIVALQVRVMNMNKTGDVRFRPIDERIQLEAGQSYRISLVGSESLRDPRGDIGIHARFAEAAGRGNISLGNAEGNWVIVETSPRSNGNAEISYQVEGNYNMPAAWRTGRIRFDLVRQVGQSNEAASGLAVRVEDMATGRVDYVDLGGNERIPLERGQRLRVSLIDSNRQPVAADFDLANRDAEIERTGSNWVILRGLDDRGRVQLAYRTADSRYASGRIGFALSGDSGYGDPGNNATDEARWRHAEDVTATLYRAVLQQDPRDSRRDFRADVQRIYDDGYDGLRYVARNLAEEARSRGVFANRSATEVAGLLYRELLDRSGSNDELYRADAGFRSAVRDLGDRSDGLVRVVEAIVGSSEFRDVQNLDDYGLLRQARY